MINSNTDITTRRHLNTMPIVGNVKSGPNGELSFNVTIKPEMLDPIMGLIGLFSEELRRAMRTRDFWRNQAMKEKIDYETGKLDFMRRKRTALSVYKKTGSVKLAARSGAWLITDVRMFIADAERNQHKAARLARNARIRALHHAGISCRDIGRKFGLSGGQVSRIINVKT